MCREGLCRGLQHFSEYVDQVGLGQTGKFNYLLWDREFSGIVHCEPACKAKKCSQHKIILLLFLEAF